MTSRIDYINTTAAIRERCYRIFEYVRSNQSWYFNLNLTKLDFAASYVIKTIKENYPDLNIPYHSRWRHFNDQNVDRIAILNDSLQFLDPEERLRSKLDLAIISVLMDAGAGSYWKYYDQRHHLTYSRSEGLAVASFNMFMNGYFSSSTHQFQVDALALRQITLEKLAEGLQIHAENSIQGLEGRLQLLNQLGESMELLPEYFGEHLPRIGNLLNYFRKRFIRNQFLSAKDIFNTVISAFGQIWPGRIKVNNKNLGDVWRHSAIVEDDETNQLVPFHKLSQWLTYSLFEPLEELNIEISDVEALTGLAEYRNGGLFFDLGVITLKEHNLTNKLHSVESEFIVEWRALTLVLLDEIAKLIQNKLNLDAQQLSLAKILEGGTWKAGRKIAKEKRADGSGPFKIESDGTVF